MRRRLWVSLSVAAAAALAGAPAAEVRGEDPLPRFRRSFTPGVNWSAPVVAVGGDGTTYVAGAAWGAHPLDPAAGPFDRWTYWVAALAPDGTLRWSAALPTASANGWATGDVRALAAAPGGGVWLLGSGECDASLVTLDRGSPGADADALVARFDATGRLVAAVTLGGSGREQPTGIAVAPEGDVLVVGSTDSADFPVVAATQALHAGSRDGFVARLRADASGFAWATYIGGPAEDDVQAVAVDAAGDVLVTRRTGTNPYGEVEAGRDGDVDSLVLLRLAPDGSATSSVTLPHGDAGSANAVLALEGGAVLVAGVAFHEQTGRQHGYVARVEAGGTSASRVWRSDVVPARRLAPLPGERVAVGGPPEWSWDRQWAVVDADLTRHAELRSTAPGRAAPTDGASAPDGTLVFAGIQHVERVPVTTVRPSGRLRVTRTGERFVELAWRDVDEDAVAWEVEATPWSAWTDGSDLATATAAADARTALLGRLEPSTVYDVRLVAVLASGERVEVGALTDVATSPAAPRNATLDVVDGHLRLRWTDDNVGPVGHEFERRVGDGPWAPVPDFSAVTGDRQEREIVVSPAALGAPTSLRVRAASGGASSAWTEPAPVQGAPGNLDVRLTRTSLRLRARRAGTLQVSGTFTPRGDATPAEFQPEFDVLRLQFGDAGWPVAVRIPPWGWQPGAILRFVGVDEENRGGDVRVEFRRRGGKGLLRIRYDAPPGVLRAFRRAELGVSYGARAGTDVR